MKRIVCFLFLMANVVGLAIAQSSDNLTRNVLVAFDDNEIVKPGEFQMELLKGALYDEKNENPWFSFVYTVTNRFTGKCNIFVNDREKLIDENAMLRTYRIGSAYEKGIFVVKNMGAAKSDIGKGMEMVVANGIVHPACDTVLYLNDDGYVYSNKGRCYFGFYKNQNIDQARAIPIVWLMRKTFNPNRKNRSQDQVGAFSHLSGGDVYYESFEGHYYFVYRDKYMPYSVLVVDNKEVELFDVYNEDNFQLKFSYDGSHWMAVGKECYWVDGVMKSVAGYDISDFVINNEGHYGYLAYKKDVPQAGEVIVTDGKIVRRNAKVSYFGLNAEGKLKFRFVTGGRSLQYEDDVVTDETDRLVSVFYPSNKLNGEKVTVLSSDGTHRLTYKIGTPEVAVDGVTVAKSFPCFALYDDRYDSFIWNAVEDKDGKNELVIYKYKVKVANNFFW